MITREQAFEKVKRDRLKDRITLERVGLPVMTHMSKAYIYYTDDTPENAGKGFSKSENVEIEGYHSELRGFTFNKAYERWYWCVVGKMPMLIAKELYNNPCGKTDIRVDGHCGCPAPDEEPWFRWITDDGKKVLNSEDYDYYVQTSERHPELKENLTKYVKSDEPHKIAKQYVTLYHVDTELALKIFVDTVKDMDRPRP